MVKMNEELEESKDRMAEFNIIMEQQVGSTIIDEVLMFKYRMIY